MAAPARASPFTRAKQRERECSSASRRDETPSLRSRLFTCERTVCSEMNEPLGDLVRADMLVEEEQHLDLACAQHGRDPSPARPSRDHRRPNLVE